MERQSACCWWRFHDSMRKRVKNQLSPDLLPPPHPCAAPLSSLNRGKKKDVKHTHTPETQQKHLEGNNFLPSAKGTCPRPRSSGVWGKGGQPCPPPSRPRELNLRRDARGDKLFPGRHFSSCLHSSAACSSGRRAIWLAGELTAPRRPGGLWTPGWGLGGSELGGVGAGGFGGVWKLVRRV